MTPRHPGARRAPHEKREDADDVFIAKILEINTWARSNQQLLTVAGIVLVGLVALGIYYARFQAARTQQAAQEIEAIHQSVSLGDLEGAKNELSLYLQRFGGTPYEAEARLVLGELYLQDGEPQQAQAVLEPLGRSPRRPIELQAASLLAAAYEQERRWQEAEDVYLGIADRAELDFQVHEALASAARIRATRGDTTGAIELYERLLESLGENSPDRGLYEMRVQELRTAANI